MESSQLLSTLVLRINWLLFVSLNMYISPDLILISKVNSYIMILLLPIIIPSYLYFYLLPQFHFITPSFSPSLTHPLLLTFIYSPPPLLTFLTLSSLSLYHSLLLTFTYSPSPSHLHLLTLSFSPYLTHPLLLSFTFSPSPSHFHFLTLSFSLSLTHPLLLTLSYSPSPSLLHFLTLSFSPSLTHPLLLTFNFSPPHFYFLTPSFSPSLFHPLLFILSISLFNIIFSISLLPFFHFSNHSQSDI